MGPSLFWFFVQIDVETYEQLGSCLHSNFPPFSRALQGVDHDSIEVSSEFDRQTPESRVDFEASPRSRVIRNTQDAPDV